MTTCVSKAYAPLGNSPSLGKKTMRHCGMGDIGAGAFWATASIRSLDLAGNAIGDVGVGLLAQNRRLVSLELQGNQIGDAGAMRLAACP